MQKDLQPNEQELYDVILARLSKLYHYEYLRHELKVVSPSQKYMVLWQEMDEIDVNWDVWNLWIVVYFNLVKAGLLVAADTTPNTNEYDLRRARLREQKSNLIPEKSENKLAYETHDQSNVLIDLNLLAMHLTKAHLEKMTLDCAPQWSLRRGSFPQLVSGAELNEEQAKNLVLNIKQKLIALYPDKKESFDKAISVLASRQMPGIYRVIVELLEMSRCFTNLIPAEKPQIKTSETKTHQQDDEDLLSSARVMGM